MKIDNLTIKEVKHIQSLLKGPREGTHPYHVGNNYFIRTVTHHLTGKLVKVTAKELVLEQAAGIADDGRFHDALKNGKLNEVEPVGRCYINIQTVVDFFPWKHPLPEEQV